MSVVNQMLKELDQNKEKKPAVNSFELDQIEKKPITLWILVPLFILGIGLVYWNRTVIFDRTLTPDLVNKETPDSDKGIPHTIGHPASRPSVESSPKKESPAALSQEKSVSPILSSNFDSPPNHPEKFNFASNEVNSQPLADKKSQIANVNAQISPIISSSEKTIVDSNDSELPAKPLNKNHLKSSVRTGKGNLPPKQSAKVKSLSLQSQLKIELQKIQSESNLLSSDEVELRCEELLASHIDFHPARIFLLNYLRNQGSPEFYSKAERALEKWPENSAYLQLLARALIKDKRYREAANLLENKSLSEVLLQLRAFAWQKLGSHDKAIIDYKELLIKHSRKGSYLLAFGISLKALGYYREARLSFERALQDYKMTSAQKSWLKQQIQLLGNA